LIGGERSLRRDFIQGPNPKLETKFSGRLREVEAVWAGMVFRKFPVTGKFAGKLSTFEILPGP